MDKGQKENSATVSGILIEVTDKICAEYCKYPEICRSQRKDPDEAEDLLYDTYCEKCPMNRLF